ncbi:MAG: hypothetical protein AB7G23_01645 [Vicinamibacterales bacterium]
MTVARLACGLLTLALVGLLPAGARAQGGRQGGGRGGPPPTPQAAAPVDLTGYWVSIVADDWRWRMVTPPKGDVLYLPVNAEGRRVAEAWDPAADEAAGEICKAYGAPGVMSLPGRLHITWQDASTLQVDIDTGTQTRLLHFGDAPAGVAPSLQGDSRASWEYAGGRPPRGGGPGRGGSLKVVTRRLLPGYFRKNGVPYGGDAVLTEHYARVSGQQDDEYLLVTRILEDPQYLNAPYVRTVQFRKQDDASGWNPTPCSAR